MNQLEFSFIGWPCHRRGASRPIPRRKSSLSPISSPFLPSRLFGISSAGVRRGGVSWPPARPGALRRDAARCVATRRGAARCGKGTSAKGVFPPCIPRAAARWDHHGDRRPYTFILRDISPWSLSALCSLPVPIAPRFGAARKARAAPAAARVASTLGRRSVDWARSHFAGDPTLASRGFSYEGGYARLAAYLQLDALFR